jgi:nitroreductase
METLEAISKRASLKTCLSPRDVEREKIEKILEAARLAPSGRNMQPWRFIVVEGKENVENVVTKGFIETNHIIKGAPVLIIAFVNAKEHTLPDGRALYFIDVGLAMENILLAATDLGLVTHPMTGVNEAELKKTLGVPEEMKFIIATPLAYPVQGSYEQAAREKLSQRTRKSLQELVYYNEWGKSF